MPKGIKGFQKGHKSYIDASKVMKQNWKEGKFKDRKIDYEMVAKKNSITLKNKYKLGVLTPTKSIFKLGNVPWNKGKENKKISGSLNHMWNNGSSFEPYSVDWTQTLKKSIRERDRYTCQICNKEGNVIHHIDYNKKNSNPNNLITLCNSCHSKTNHNRNKWFEYFNIKGGYNY